MVERWNGSRWRLQSIPRPSKSTELLGVSCSRVRSCVAVGDKSGGGDATPLAESWNGRRWRVRAVRLPHMAPAGLFSAVSCTSPSACTTTGTDFGTPHPTLAERWNGTNWQVETTPNPSDWESSFGAVALDGVSCTSARACTASGDYSPGGAAAYFVESWNGRHWRLQPVPVPTGFMHGALLGMSCVVGGCTGVGAYTGTVRLQVTLAMAN